MCKFCMSSSAIAMVILMIVGCTGSNDSGDAEPAADDAWTTVAILRSSDPTFQDLDNILVSEPFTVSGDVRVVMDMPDGGRVDGVGGVIMAADKATDSKGLLQGIRDGESVILIGAAPTKVVSGLDGTYVFMNAVPAPQAWSLEIQVRD